MESLPPIQFGFIAAIEQQWFQPTGWVFTEYLDSVDDEFNEEYSDSQIILLCQQFLPNVSHPIRHFILVLCWEFGMQEIN